jgi:membrane-associated phospholipid phosphatase
MIVRLSIIAACLAIIICMLLLGGAANPLDVMLLSRVMGPWTSIPETLVIALTHIGSWFVLLGMMAARAAMLMVRRHRLAAVWLVGVVVGGRLIVELVKLIVERPRPELQPHEVMVSSFSFPSGHAANSMITFLALAVTMRGSEQRGTAIVAAILGGIAVGCTRPMLGVHWPSDVIAGWAFAVAWVTLCQPLLNPRAETAA